MKKNTVLILILIALSLALLFIVIARWNEANAPEHAAPVIESTDVQALAAPKPTVSNADLTPPPAPTPEPTEEPEEDPAEKYATTLSASEIPVITPKEEVPITPQPVQGRYGDSYLSADEIEVLARLVYLEARGESFEGQQAVAEVVLNRVLSPSFPGNVYDVVYQSGQFTPAGEIAYTTCTQTQYDAVAAALTGPNILPQQVLYFACGQNGRSNVWGWIGNHCFCY